MSTNKKNWYSQYVISIASVITVAASGFLFHNIGGYKVVAFLLLVTVSILAMLFDILPVLLAAALSALIWDFFFIPPRFTFSVGSTEDKLTLLMYFVIALVNGVMTYKIRQAEKRARLKEEKEKEIKLYNTMFNSLSHELQTPISTIIGATDTLKDNAIKLTDKNKDTLVDEIAIASFRLKEQVENLLNMSRLESGHVRLKKDWCDMNELVYSVINKLHNKSTWHRITVNIPENFPLFRLDYGIMEQILYNLLNNALLYTPANSVISVTAQSDASLARHLNEELGQGETHKGGTLHKLTIIISDNGKGFPENEINNAFDKFYRLNDSHAGGTGLGLSIVRGFVEAHNGRIMLNNVLTGGAEFKIEIPANASYLNALKNE